MSLIACPECNKQISSQSETCVGCGYKPQMSKADIALTNIAVNVSKIWTVILVSLGLSVFALLLTLVNLAGKK